MHRAVAVGHREQVLELLVAAAGAVEQRAVSRLRSLYPGIPAPMKAEGEEMSANCCISGGVMSCRVVGVRTRPTRRLT